MSRAGGGWRCVCTYSIRPTQKQKSHGRLGPRDRRWPSCTGASTPGRTAHGHAALQHPPSRQLIAFGRGSVALPRANSGTAETPKGNAPRHANSCCLAQPPATAPLHVYLRAHRYTARYAARGPARYGNRCITQLAFALASSSPRNSDGRILRPSFHGRLSKQAATAKPALTDDTYSAIPSFFFSCLHSTTCFSGCKGCWVCFHCSKPSAPGVPSYHLRLPVIPDRLGGATFCSDECTARARHNHPVRVEHTTRPRCPRRRRCRRARRCVRARIVALNVGRPCCRPHGYRPPYMIPCCSPSRFMPFFILRIHRAALLLARFLRSLL